MPCSWLSSQSRRKTTQRQVDLHCFKLYTKRHGIYSFNFTFLLITILFSPKINFELYVLGWKWLVTNIWTKLMFSALDLSNYKIFAALQPITWSVWRQHLKFIWMLRTFMHVVSQPNVHHWCILPSNWMHNIDAGDAKVISLKCSKWEVFHNCTKTLLQQARCTRIPMLLNKMKYIGE